MENSTKTPAIKTIDIKAKTWFDKANGNSYFAAVVTLDFGLPTQKEIKIPFQYGYGEQYITESVHQLQTEGILSSQTIYNLHTYCIDNKIILRTYNQKDCRKSDLKNLIS